MKTITANALIETAEHIRDFNISMMDGMDDYPALCHRRCHAMSQIEGLKTLAIHGFGYDNESPTSVVLHNIWRQLLNYEAAPSGE